MIVKANLYSILWAVFFMAVFQAVSSQEKSKSTTVKTFNSVYAVEVRGTNALSVAIGATMPKGDLPKAAYEIYMHIGYKRFLGPFVNFNVAYNKYNLTFKEVFNEGFMSFDANLELVPFPKNIVSPFVFGGGGINASNYFKVAHSKVQGGAGFEVLVSPLVGVKLFGEYNLMFTDELEGKIEGDSNDAFWRAAIGLNIYFGKRGKRRIVNKNEPTVINSNPITHSNN